MGGPWYADNELLPVELSYDAGGADLTGYKLRLSHGSSVELWTTQKKDALVASEFTIGTDTIPTLIYVEGIDVGQSNITWRLEKSDARGFLIIPMDDDSVTLTVVNHDLKAYRPQTEGPGYGGPFARTAVPFAVEENPGVGIRRNGDDDDDGTADLNPTDTGIIGENDLIEVVLKALLASPDGIEYVLKRSNTNINVWDGRVKTSPILTSNDEASITPNSTDGEASIWVEWATMDSSQNRATLTLEVRTDTNDPRTDDRLVFIDELKFYPFSSVVIALGGEGQIPADPPLDSNNHGTFWTAIDEYRNGYDVHMYDEDVVAWSGGAGLAYDEIVAAIQDRGVTQVAIFGYSHGGGATYELANRIYRNTLPQSDSDRLDDITSPFTMPYTAYVDAITQETIGAENRRPPMTAFHVNLYQTNSIASGGLTGGPANGDDDFDVTTRQWGINLDHFTIDDEPNVRNWVKMRLEQKVAR